MESKAAQEANRKVLDETDLTGPQKEVILKTAAVFTRTELKELEKLLRDTKTNTLMFQDRVLAYHR